MFHISLGKHRYTLKSEQTCFAVDYIKSDEYDILYTM